MRQHSLLYANDRRGGGKVLVSGLVRGFGFDLVQVFRTFGEGGRMFVSLLCEGKVSGAGQVGFDGEGGRDG